MAENITLAEASDIKNEVDDALPKDIKKHDGSSEPCLFPKLEDGPMSTFPSISVPFKVEPDSQEFGSTSITDQEVMNSTICSVDGVIQPKLWRCNVCGKTEKSFLILDLHIDTGCEELSPIECDVCPAVFRDYRSFVAHFMEHQMGETRRCLICLQGNISNMKEHLNLQGHFSQNESETAFQGGTSQVTSQELSTSISLISFKLNSRVTGQNKPFQCDICKKTFAHLAHLTRHKRVHTGEKPFQCFICKKSFAQLEHLTRHKRVHTGEKPFQCNICKKSFAELGSLICHKRVHTGKKPFHCDTCKKTFSKSGNLISHKRVHTGEKPFHCDICKKNFSDSSTLKKHQRVHTGEKPFQCNICEKVFAQLAHLTRHKRVHTGEKPFQCNICEKTFAQLAHLTRHKLVHTGEKPFQCNI